MYTICQAEKHISIPCRVSKYELSGWCTMLASLDCDDVFLDHTNNVEIN